MATRAVLLLECDADKLGKENRPTPSRIAAACDALEEHVDFHHIKTTKESKLLGDLGALVGKGVSVDLVVVVAHSNREGIQLTAASKDHDGFCAWSSFADWLDPLQPWGVVLVACEAGRWIPSANLFDGIENLDEIYACPAGINDNQALIVNLLIPYLLVEEVPHEGLEWLANAANLIFTGGLLMKHTRAQWESDNPAMDAWKMLHEEIIAAAIDRRRS